MRSAIRNIITSCFPHRLPAAERRNHPFTFRPAPHARVLFLLAMVVIAGAAEAQKSDFKEHEVKAVFLYNFLQFTEWPDSAFETESSPIVLGVLGNDPFGSILNQVVETETVGNRPIIIRRFSSLGELGQCHVLYISSSEKRMLGEILKQTGQASTLTVSDLDHFGSLGGTIGFYLEKNKIRFEVNLESLRRSNLKMSSKLLRLARVLDPSG